MRIDYSELVVALKKGDEPTANKLLDEVMPRLTEYLRVVMKADENVAQECAQQAFADVYERIRKGKIKEKKYIFSYLLTATKNEFLKYSKFQHRFQTGSDAIYDQALPAEQILALMDKERMSILSECMNELDRESRTFIQYIIDHPEKSSKDYGRRFDMSEANVRTKKSRVVSQLHFCYKRKSSE